MKAYLDVLRDVSENGKMKGNRTGVRTKSVFSQKFRCDLRDGFPLLTTKKVNFRKVAGEMFAFLNGADTIQGFQEFDCDIWDPWGLKAECYQLNKLDPEKYAERLAEKDNITVEEAVQNLAETEEAYKAWHDEYTLLIQKVGVGEATGDDMNAHLVKAPLTVMQHLQSAGVALHEKHVIYPAGYLGPIYGKQWLEWKTSTGELINQIKRVSHQLEQTPFSRRIIISGWNPEVIPADKYEKFPDGRPVQNSDDNVQASILNGKQALPPCHLMTILNVVKEEFDPEPTLNLHLTMRSTDVPIGLPFNIASYALLLKMIAKQFDMVAGELVIEMVDCHIYEDQLELVKTQLERTPTQLPTLEIPDGIYFDDPSTLTRENFERVVNALEGYTPQAFIKYPVAV